MIFKTQDKTITTFQGIEKKEAKRTQQFLGKLAAKNQVIKTGAFNKLKEQIKNQIKMTNTVEKRTIEGLTLESSCLVRILIKKNVSDYKIFKL